MNFSMSLVLNNGFKTFKSLLLLRLGYGSHESYFGSVVKKSKCFYSINDFIADFASKRKGNSVIGRQLL